MLVSVVLILFFSLASSIKIAGWQPFIFDTQLAFFVKYGLQRSHMFAVGVIELTASIALLVALLSSSEVLTQVGAALIALTSVGALYFHLRFDTLKDGIPAVITFALSSYLFDFALWQSLLERV